MPLPRQAVASFRDASSGGRTSYRTRHADKDGDTALNDRPPWRFWLMPQGSVQKPDSAVVATIIVLLDFYFYELTLTRVSAFR